jgi:hypothetical protein
MELSGRNKSVRSYIKRADKEGGEEEIGKLVKWGVVKVEAEVEVEEAGREWREGGRMGFAGQLWDSRSMGNPGRSL